jgi:AbrB family looped-hinge helix DNA binding protein
MRPLISTLSAKGQTTIPARVRRELDIKAGDTIAYEMAGNSVHIRKTTPLDIEWAKAVEATLTEWSADDDDDL